MKQAPDGTARLAELQYLLRYGGTKQACPLSCARRVAAWCGSLRLQSVRAVAVSGSGHRAVG